MRVSFMRHRSRRPQSSIMLFMACAALLLSMIGNGLIATQGIAAQDTDSTPASALQSDSLSQAIVQGEGDDTIGDDDVPDGEDSPEDGPVIGVPGTEDPAGTEESAGTEEPAGTEPVEPVVADDEVDDPPRLVIGDEPTVRVYEYDPGTVLLAKFTCPDGVEPSGGVAFLASQCAVETDPVSFTVSNGEGYSQSQTATAGYPQQAMFEGVPSGMITISESVPTGYGEPLLFCIDTPVDTTAFEVQVPVSDASGNWDHHPGEGRWLSCAFFNFPLADNVPDSRDVHVSKYTCAAGYIPLDDDYLMSEQCLEDVTPIEFSINAPGGWSQTQAAEPGAPQSSTFGMVPFGGIEISETVPPGYGMPSVFCTDIPVDGPGAYEPVPVTSGGSVSLVHRADAEIDLTCLFFNFPLEEEEDSNQLTVTKFDCPPGIDPMLGLPDLGTTCGIMPGVTFKLNGGVSQATDPSGNTSWAGIPAAPWTVTETVPPGYDPEPVVFCGPMFETEAPRVTVIGGAFSGEFTGTGIHMVCTVFNFQDGGEGRDVHFHKYTCPPEIERTSDWYALGETCFEEIDPVQLSVNVPSAGYSETKTMTPGAPQTATFDDVPFGTLYLEEMVPEGFNHPLVFCTDTPADGAGNYIEVEPWPESGAFIWEHRADAEIDLTCIIFNFHEQEDNTVTVNKYVCPPGVNAETDDLMVECAPGGDGIWFDFVDGNGIHTAAVTGGMVEWTGVVIGAEGELQIIETIPPGYGEPWVVCDGILMSSAGGFVIPNPGEARPFHIVCDWFNFAEEDSTLIVVKHECPPGYDPNAYGANPEVDCATLADGVDFHLTGPGTDITSTTGDAGSGMVQFTELDPGDYVVVETMPEGTAWSFISTCYGNAVGSVRPFPLATGDTLNLTVHAGEEIVCHWFNVPDQDDTSLTVIKYTCTTASYVSEVDCEIEESGITFDLVWWNGGAWDWSATGTTDAVGHLNFGPLDPGEYWLYEHGGEWCHLSSAAISDDGNWLNVLDDEKAEVKVYNCDGTPGTPGKTPTKYPNTGVPPTGGESTTLPMAASVVGLLGVTLNRRRLVALAVLLPVSTFGTRAVIAQDQVIEPLESTPNPTAETLCLPSEPGDDPAECRRGPVPGTIRIESIGVENPIEILETVGGVMQQPSDETYVAWYKETARLGETGNILLAGHVNWWGFPEAVFFNLGQVVEGDEIVLVDAADMAFTYSVEWVNQESNLDPPREEVLGMTDYEAVTLMTCSGKWNSEISEYDSRTVVRAKRIDNDGTPAA